MSHELVEKISLLNRLLKERLEIYLTLIPWERSYANYIATNPNLKTETQRKSAIEDITQYPSDMRNNWNRMNQLDTEIEITRNEIEILKIIVKDKESS